MEMADNQENTPGRYEESTLDSATQGALDYALQHDLFKALNKDPMSEISHPSSLLRRSLPITNVDGFTSDERLTEFEMGVLDETKDVWDVSNRSFSIIQRTCRKLSEDEVEAYAKQACPPGRMKALRLETPALRSDPDYDYRQMRSNIASMLKVSVGNHGLPLEPTDVEEDEGLEFPSAAWHCGEVIMQQIEKETIDVSRSAFRYLTEQLKDDWSDEKQRELLSSEICHKPNRVLDSMTPPIVPDLGTEDYFIPPYEACQVPIPSERSSSLSAELKNVEDTLFEQTKDEWAAGSQSPPAALPSLSSSPIKQYLLSQLDERVRPDDLKVEEPLLRNEASSEIASVQPIDMDQIAKSIPQPDLELPTPNESMELALEAALQDAETRVIRSIEQEHLDPWDARARVPIPVMDFSIPEPEWVRLGNNENAMFQYIREGNVSAFNLPKWPKNRREEDKMRWNPFVSSTARVSTAEQLNVDEGALENLLAISSDSNVLTSANCVWKRPGLLIFREEDFEDEEEIQPVFAHTPSQNDLMAIVKKKKSMLAEGSKSRITFAPAVADQQPSTHSHHKRRREELDCETPILASDDSTAASTLLQNFMNLHAYKKPKYLRSPYFTKINRDVPKTATPAHTTAMVEEGVAAPLDALPSAPVPSVNAPSAPIKVVMSMHLQLGVTGELRQLLPCLSAVYRDYTAHNTSVWHPGSVCRSEVMPCLAQEVDITVSAATGIFITTMTKLRQKPVPGADGKSVLRTLIEKVSLRYERLIILVSEGGRDETMAELSPSAATAFVELQGFIGSLNTSTSMFYVAGGDKALAAWVASLICQHQQEGLGLQHFLMNDETSWELFLRQAGMNAYAAQIVVGILQPPTNLTEAAASGKYGLPGFVNMSAEERVSRFAGILGGRRVLDRVSRIVDTSWE